MAYIEIPTGIVSSIAWSKSGLPEYNNYDLNTSFFTPNNVNEILSCITNHKNLISSLIVQVNECARTVNNISPINGNITLGGELGVTQFNGKTGNIKLLYNDYEPQSISEAGYTKFLINSDNTIASINNVHAGTITIVDQTGKMWQTDTDDNNNTTITINANYSTIDNQDGNTDFYHGNVKLSKNDGKITIPAFPTCVYSINNHYGKFNFQQNGIQIDDHWDSTTQQGTINYNIPTLIYDGVPVGTIISWYGSLDKEIPRGWHICNGDPIDATYTELISLVGTNYPNLTDGKYIQYGSYVDVTNTSPGLPNISGIFPAGLTKKRDHAESSKYEGAFSKSDIFVDNISIDDIPSYNALFNAAQGTLSGSAAIGNLGYMPEANSPYGKSNTVTPYHITLLPLIKCYNTNNQSSVDTELNSIKAELSNINTIILSLLNK